MRDYQTVSICKSLMSFTAFRFEPGSSHPISLNKKKEPCYARLLFLAENEGFEPPVPLGTIVFKTTAIDHSANSPRQK